MKKSGDNILKKFCFHEFRHSLCKAMAKATVLPREKNHTIHDLINLAITRYPESYGPMLGLMPNMAIMLSEVIGLHWDDIDFSNNSITVRRSINNRSMARPPKMGIRTIPLLPAAKAILTELLNSQGSNITTPQVFTNNGRYFRRNEVILHLKPLATELGMDISPNRRPTQKFHQNRLLRHSMAAKY